MKWLNPLTIQGQVFEIDGEQKTVTNSRFKLDQEGTIVLDDGTEMSEEEFIREASDLEIEDEVES